MPIYKGAELKREQVPQRDDKWEKEVQWKSLMEWKTSHPLTTRLQPNTEVSLKRINSWYKRPCRRVDASASAKVASLIPRGDLFNSTWQHHSHLWWPHHNLNFQRGRLPYSFKVHLYVMIRGNCHKIDLDIFEWIWIQSHGVHIWLLSTSPMARITTPL